MRLALPLALALACGESRAPQAPSPSEAPAPASETATPSPQAGGVRMRLDGQRITLHASGAPRRGLLEMLARELDFELVAPDLGSEPVSADVEDMDFAELVPRLLPDRAFRIDYRLDAVGGPHRVARLEVAPLGASVPPRPAPPTTPTPGADDRLAGEPAPEPGPDAAEEPDESPEAVDWKQLLLRLDDADADERIDALEEIDPDGEGLALIADRLARDPDPRVRVVAAEQLEFADTLAAVDALVLALSDPDRQVVLAAIDALELTDDQTVVNELEQLFDNPDDEIREAARDAVEFIRMGPEED